MTHDKLRIASCGLRVTSHESRVTGFTLIELVVALTIFSVIGIAIYGSLSTGINIWRRNIGHQATYQDSGILVDILRYDLANAVDIAGIPFTGSKNSMEFIVLKRIFDAETKLFKKELKHVRYHVENESGREALYRFESPFPHKADINTKGSRVMYRLAGTGFQYYGFKRKSGDKDTWDEGVPWEWMDKWHSSGELPKAVWLKTTMEPKDEDTGKAILDRKFRIPSGSGEQIEEAT